MKINNTRKERFCWGI